MKPGFVQPCGGSDSVGHVATARVSSWSHMAICPRHFKKASFSNWFNSAPVMLSFHDGRRGMRRVCRASSGSLRRLKTMRGVLAFHTKRWQAACTHIEAAAAISGADEESIAMVVWPRSAVNSRWDMTALATNSSWENQVGGLCSAGVSLGTKSTPLTSDEASVTEASFP